MSSSSSIACLHLGDGPALIQWKPSYHRGAIMPTNRRLKAAAPDHPPADARALLIAWGRFHIVRTVLGVIALILYLIAIGG